MADFGYARVSTNGQDPNGQIAELAAAGCAKVYREKASGAKTDRPELAKLLRVLDADDVLIVTRLKETDAVQQHDPAIRSRRRQR